ncbi:hypothetical protein IFM89_004112 [Coptis chinensis]|uniref:F-box protein n=1 Tax=Coptis chinensis TaxID=261450 RepID=A0A835LGZ3_9MAGN|nr:hypothetical protein IFM89_004112 [Coptis chinensis]
MDEGVATTSISSLHHDIINTHLLTRLDGPTLASTSCASSQLHTLSNDENLWTNICLSTWPSTDDPRIRQFISNFPNGPRSFFSKSFPLLISHPDPPSQNLNPPSQTQELISAVDIHYQGKSIFSKVQEIETHSGWFRCSPFRIDLLDPKDVVPTSIVQKRDTRRDLFEELRLSWIIINPVGKQAANFSSWRPVSVQRHWLTNEVQVRFATILGVDQVTDVQCGIIVTFGGEMQVREVSLQVENMDGINLNGKDSLGILEKAIQSGERKKGRREEARERYEEYVTRMRERKEKKLRIERRLDALCVAIGVSILASFWMLVLLR